MPTQNENQRKIAAEKAAATRKRNAANRSRSAKKAAETRARAQLNVVQALGLQAERAVDTAIGATLIAGDNVAEAARQLRDPLNEVTRLRGELETTARKFERRGAQTRKRTVREATRRRDRAVRTLKRTRRDVEQQVNGTRRDVQSATEGLFNRAQDQAKSIA